MEIRNCIVCKKEFQFIRRQRVRTCSDECLKIIKEIEAKNPKPKKKIKRHYKECLYCHKKFRVKARYKNIKFCSYNCGYLNKAQIKFNSVKLRNEYINIDKWAQDFKLNHHKRPNVVDVGSYFGIYLIPGYANKKLFRPIPKNDSRLELIVIHYLTTKYKFKIQRRKRILIEDVNNKFKNKEIDIYLPDLNIGFEIQDFATHTRSNDFEKILVPQYITKDNIYKKNYDYHEHKRLLAKKQNIELFDIWEDEILSNKFMNKLDEILKKT